jgi:adenylate cyclase, class 2
LPIAPDFQGARSVSEIFPPVVAAIMRNIELKAECPDLEAARSQARSLGAKRMGVFMQTDTYFHVRFGRLKLREVQEEPGGHLVAYHREDRAAVRASDYELVSVPDAASTKRALARTLGIRVIVVKRRELWQWRNVRIHLDDVEHLGTFLEFEAVVDGSPDDAGGNDIISRLARHFGVEPAAVQAASYAELLIAAAG